MKLKLLYVSIIVIFTILIIYAVYAATGQIPQTGENTLIISVLT